MSDFTLYETQNLNSIRAGTPYSGTLHGAKCAATRVQQFQGTVLKIADSAGDIVAVKYKLTGVWFDPRDYQ